MGISFNTPTSSSGRRSGNGQTMTFNHAVTNDGSCVVVFISTDLNYPVSGERINGVTCGGQSMSRLVSEVSGSYAALTYVYSLDAVSSGSSEIVISFANLGFYACDTIATAVDVSGGTIHALTGNTYAVASTTSNVISGISPGGYMLDVLTASSSSPTITATSGQTIVASPGAFYHVNQRVAWMISSSPAQNMVYTTGTSNSNARCAICFSPGGLFQPVEVDAYIKKGLSLTLTLEGVDAV